MDAILKGASNGTFRGRDSSRTLLMEGLGIGAAEKVFNFADGEFDSDREGRLYSRLFSPTTGNETRCIEYQ